MGDVCRVPSLAAQKELRSTRLVSISADLCLISVNGRSQCLMTRIVYRIGRSLS